MRASGVVVLVVDAQPPAEEEEEARPKSPVTEDDHNLVEEREEARGTLIGLDHAHDGAITTGHDGGASALPDGVHELVLMLTNEVGGWARRRRSGAFRTELYLAWRLLVAMRRTRGSRGRWRCATERSRSCGGSECKGDLWDVLMGSG